MRITIEQTLSADLIETFYGVYVKAFEPLRTRAAARHLMTVEEFTDEMLDGRVDKYVAWNDSDQPIGLTTLTTDLSAVPWVSEDFYASRFPEQAARGALFYLGYTLVHPDNEREGIMARIIARIVQRMHQCAGVCAFDVSGYNDDTHGIGAKIAQLGRWRPMDFMTVDQQRYYAAVFHGPTATRVPRQRTGEPATPQHPPGNGGTAGSAGNGGTAGSAGNGGTAGSGNAHSTVRSGGTLLAERTTTRTVTLAERPDLAPAIPDVLGSRWPAFMLAGRPGHTVDLDRLLGIDAPAHQVLLLDTTDRVLGVGLSVPLTWDGTAAGLPAGWDAAVTASARVLADGVTPTMVSALSVTLRPEAAGHGHAATVVHAMKAAAIQAGSPGMLVPVRPVWKPKYPLIPLDRYATWRTDDGRIFDPWLRLHQHLGARIVGIAEDSLTVTGTVAQWQAWTGLALPDSGRYAIPGGLVPLEVDLDRDTGTYREPNVWVFHPAN